MTGGLQSAGVKYTRHLQKQFGCTKECTHKLAPFTACKMAQKMVFFGLVTVMCALSQEPGNFYK